MGWLRVEAFQHREVTVLVMTTYMIFVAITLLTGVVLIVGVPNMIGSLLGWGLVLVAGVGIATLLDYKGKHHDDRDKV